jgi:hypothetical protein
MPTQVRPLVQPLNPETGRTSATSNNCISSNNQRADPTILLSEAEGVDPIMVPDLGLAEEEEGGL